MSWSPRLDVAARTLGALVAGLAVGWSFPPHGPTWLMPVGIAGIALLLRGRRLRAGLGYGWVFGLGYMWALMPWLRVIGYDAWVALGVIEALFYGLMGLAWAATSTRRWWPVAAAASWVGAELLRGTVPFGGLPWGRLAFGLVDTPFDRYGRLGGTALVSFLAVLVVTLLVSVGLDLVSLLRRRTTASADPESADSANSAYSSRPAWRSRPSAAAAKVVVALVIVLVSLVLPVGLAGATRTVTVAAIQGNVQGVGLHSFSHRLQVLRNHVEATERLAREVAAGTRPKPDFVLWPESSSDLDPFETPAARDAITRAVRAIGVPILVGAVVDGPDEQHVQNMGIVWSPRTGPGEEYVKQHLVPFGEYIPFRSILTKFIQRLSLIPKDFAPGHRVGQLDIGGVPIGDLICFEVAYDGLTRSIVDAGAQLITVQTNNADYVGTGQLAQQFAISRYRAIESGRQVVIASTDGISGIITGTGSVVATGPSHAQVVLDEPVTLATGRTLGIRFGGWLDIGFAVLGLALALVAGWDTRRRTGRIGW